VLNPSVDAYESSFVILAMAWHHRATGSAEALHLGEQAYECLQHRLSDTEHGGFFEEHPLTAKLPRRQNPHMHLLEATLAMHGAAQAPIWLERATAMVGMFQRAFFDAETGSLGEYFDAQWRPIAGPEGALREPGHQFEWVWLLQQYIHASGRTDLKTTTLRLFQFGTRHCVNPEGPMQGAVYDEVDKSGAPRAQSMFDATGQTVYRDKALAHWQLMRTHFFRKDGCNWINQVGPQGEPLVNDTLSRVLYHVVHSFRTGATGEGLMSTHPPGAGV
jgi:mannose/cellobiose epimerase-like protein (N-acyl-D-glucosamine 2-epimerase family)